MNNGQQFGVWIQSLGFCGVQNEGGSLFAGVPSLFKGGGSEPMTEILSQEGNLGTAKTFPALGSPRGTYTVNPHSRPETLQPTAHTLHSEAFDCRDLIPKALSPKPQTLNLRSRAPHGPYVLPGRCSVYRVLQDKTQLHPLCDCLHLWLQVQVRKGPDEDLLRSQLETALKTKQDNRRT